MRTLGNLLWLLLGGLYFSIVFFLSGLICCITIFLIPVGLQYFKLAGFIILPFGKTVEPVSVNGFKTFCNIFWAIIGGWYQFLILGLLGVIFHITIIGIPFGKQYYKLAKFTIMPLGHDFVIQRA